MYLGSPWFPMTTKRRTLYYPVDVYLRGEGRGGGEGLCCEKVGDARRAAL